MLLASCHISQPNYNLPKGSVLNIAWRYLGLGLRIEDAKADFVLGVRVILASKHHQCTNTAAGNCEYPLVRGWVIATCAVMDLALEALSFQLYKYLFGVTPGHQMSIIFHVIMLCCEVTILINAMFVASSSNTINSDEELGSERAYTILCCCTTALALMYIIAMVSMPLHLRQVLREDGPTGLIRQLLRSKPVHPELVRACVSNMTELAGDARCGQAVVSERLSASDISERQATLEFCETSDESGHSLQGSKPTTLEKDLDEVLWGRVCTDVGGTASFEGDKKASICVSGTVGDVD
jgi:hypothetical protein